MPELFPVSIVVDAVAMVCRSDCGACCIAPSIRQPYFGMPFGKPAGSACIHLDADMSCALFDDPRRPAFCASFMPELDACGDNRVQALQLLFAMDGSTTPFAPAVDSL